MTNKAEELRERYFGVVNNCKCENQVRRKLTMINGGIQAKNQCINCGKISQALKLEKGDENLEEIDKELPHQISRDIYTAYLKELKRLEIEEKTEAQASYHEYLTTDKWKKIKKKVLERDKYICQGCLVAEAVLVHHLTYSNIYNEFAFELVSLCQECHNRVHEND